MCLAKVYVNGKNSESLLEDIAHLRIDGDQLLLKTLFGEEKAVTGHVLDIDFAKSKITIDQQ